MAELLSISVHWKRSQSSMRFRSSQSRQILYRFFKLWVWWTWNHACKRIRTTLPYTWRIRKIHLHFAVQMVLNLNRSRLFGRQPSCRPLFIIISTNMLSDYLRHQILSISGHKIRPSADLHKSVPELWHPKLKTRRWGLGFGYTGSNPTAHYRWKRLQMTGR